MWEDKREAGRLNTDAISAYPIIHRGTKSGITSEVQCGVGLLRSMLWSILDMKMVGRSLIEKLRKLLHTTGR